MMSLLQSLLAVLPAWSAEVPADPAERVARVEEMYEGYRRLGFAKVPEIDAAGVVALDRPVLVDVRTPAEQAVSMIPGAVTRDVFDANREAYAGRPVVAYCTIGARSGLYVKKLIDDGIDARNLRGSLLLWTFAGGALEHEGQPTTRVHTYGKKWAIVADGYQAEW